MDKAETLKLLSDIADAYPLFLKDRDPEKTAVIWQECLEYEKADDLHQAFITYLKNDTRNVPPAPGALLQYVDHSSIPIDDF